MLVFVFISLRSTLSVILSLSIGLQIADRIDVGDDFLHWVTKVILPHDWSDSSRILSCDWSLVRSQQIMLSQVTLAHTALAAGHFTELGEGPVRGLGQVRDGHPLGLVGPQPLHSAHHPVIVPGLSRLSHVVTGPLRVPLVPGLVLSGAHARVCLKRQNLLNMLIYLDENQNTSQS